MKNTLFIIIAALIITSSLAAGIAYSSDGSAAWTEDRHVTLLQKAPGEEANIAYLSLWPESPGSPGMLWDELDDGSDSSTAATADVVKLSSSQEAAGPASLASLGTSSGGIILIQRLNGDAMLAMYKAEFGQITTSGISILSIGIGLIAALLSVSRRKEAVPGIDGEAS
jgi:hypothetical protein